MTTTGATIDLGRSKADRGISPASSARGRVLAGITVPDTPAVGTLLHDLTLTTDFKGPRRFEVEAADLARAFVREQGFDDRRAQLIWDSVALNSTPSIASFKEPEVALSTAGIGLDWAGWQYDRFPSEEMAGILKAFPRLEMKRRFADSVCGLVKAHPETTYDNFSRDFGERFVPGYKSASAVDVLMNAPFAE